MWRYVPPRSAEIQPMSQQDASATCPYRGLVLDTPALAATKLGCRPTIFIFVELGAKKNQRAVLLRCVADVDAGTAICSIAGDMFVFQQNNAPAHCTRGTVELLRSEIPQFISPDMWPANSRDLNPLDYRVRGMLQERVYRVPIRDTDKLRKHLVASWAGFQQSVVDDAVDQW